MNSLKSNSNHLISILRESEIAMKSIIIFFYIVASINSFASEKNKYKLIAKDLVVTINECTSQVAINKLIIDLSISGGHGLYTIDTLYRLPILKSTLEDEWKIFKASSVVESSGIETEIEIDTIKNGKGSIKFGIFHEETGLTFYRQSLKVQKNPCTQ